jgi:hypothetical protein
MSYVSIVEMHGSDFGQDNEHDRDFHPSFRALQLNTPIVGLP